MSNYPIQQTGQNLLILEGSCMWMTTHTSCSFDGTRSLQAPEVWRNKHTKETNCGVSVSKRWYSVLLVYVGSRVRRCCGRSLAFCKFTRLHFYFNLDGTVQADHEERTTVFQSLATRSQWKKWITSVHVYHLYQQCLLIKFTKYTINNVY